MYGYAGKILRVDLSNRKVRREDLEAELVNEFVGGQGLCAILLYKMVRPSIDPFSPENVIVISPGALVGTGVPTAGRSEVTAKSPLTNGIGSGNFGGFFGRELKQAGYDAIVIENGAEKPVYLSINDDSAELVDASDLWGRDAWESTDYLREALGQDTKVMTIGPAGENLVRFACPIVDKYHAPGRGGLGAVMGSKKLKAIAVRGTGEITVACPEKVEEVSNEINKRIEEYPKFERRLKTGSLSKVTSVEKEGRICGRNFQNGVVPGYGEALSYETIKGYFGPGPPYCSDCPMGQYYGCNLVAKVESGKYSGTILYGVSFSAVAYEWGAKNEILNFSAILKCKELCQRYGMDMYGPIPFATELYQRKLISDKDTDGIRLEWGDEDAVMEMLRKIAYRDGFGDILAEGSVRAAKKMGKDAEKYLVTVKGMELLDEDPRTIGPVSSLGILTCPRGGDNVKSTHAIAERVPLEFAARGMDEKEYMEWFCEWLDMFKPVKRKIYGSSPALVLKSARAVAMLTKWYEDLTAVFNALGFSLFATNNWSVVGPTHFAEAYSACTGIQRRPREMMKRGERIFNVMKAYNVREGFTRKDDRLPPRFYEPIPSGPAKGAVLQRSVIEGRLDEYYKLRGWSVARGIPTREKLDELGLSNFAEDLTKCKNT
jgi:aldehyde:ferredoxin oxidoreductase